MSEPTRLVSTHIGTNGHTTARVTMSPTSNKVRAEITAPPDQAIPVVFVPGIMGSPLLTSNAEAGRLLGENNRWAWFPDDGVGWVAGFTAKRGYRHLSPTERKLLLDPDTTRPVSSPEDADREVVSEHITTLPLQEALSRGWGSVMISSYGGILNFLEAQLRFIITSKGEVYPGGARCGAAQPRGVGAAQWLSSTHKGDVAGGCRVSLSRLCSGLQLAADQRQSRRLSGGKNRSHH